MVFLTKKKNLNKNHQIIANFIIINLFLDLFQLRILWIGVLCVWCVNGQKMRPIVVNNLLQSKNDTNSDEIQIGSDGNENSRQTRQLNPGGWTPIPAVWSPRPRSPLNTWWGLPWPFENGQSLVRIQPPSPYWQDYRHYEHDEHYHHHHVSSFEAIAKSFFFFIG